LVCNASRVRAVSELFLELGSEVLPVYTSEVMDGLLLYDTNFEMEFCENGEVVSVYASLFGLCIIGDEHFARIF